MKYIINSSNNNSALNNDFEKESIDELKKEFEQKENNYRSEIQDLIQQKKISDENSEKIKLELIETNVKLNESNEAFLQLQKMLDEKNEIKEILEEDNDEYEHTSICMVYVYYDGEIYLNRLADISEGSIIPFECNDNEPRLFNNRTKLFYRDGPSDKGFFGIWKWNAIPNNNDPNKDYVITQYYSNYAPIEVIVFDNIEDIRGLIDVLKSGIDVILSSYKTIFCIKTSDTSYSGILCTNKETEISGDEVRLKCDLYSVESYSFVANDIITLNGKNFYRYLRMKSSPTIVKLHDPVKIVKDIVLKRATWNALKQYNISKSEWKNYRNFISELPNNGLYEEICNACQCSQDEAEQYLSNLIISAEEYINNENIADNVLKSVILNHSDIIERCKEIRENEWQDENANKLRIANEKLKNITTETDVKQAELLKMQMEKQKAEDKLEQIISEISQKEQLAVDVEEQVAAKINNIKKNAADYISEMAFISPATSEKVCESCYCSGKDITSEEQEEYDTVITLLDIISDELQNAGIALKYCNSLAAYMYSAYLSHTSLLLAGPYGQSIANAFSAALSGKTAGVLNCSSHYDKGVVDKIIDSKDEVIVVKNPLSSEWIYSVTDLISMPDRFFVLLLPFVEDLSLEPKGLLNYVLPLFTELIIDSLPTNDFIGSKASKDFEIPAANKSGRYYRTMFRKLNVSPIAVNRINMILSQVSSFSERSEDTDLLYILLPCAYITGNEAALLKALQSETSSLSKVSYECRKIIEEYLGEYDE